MDMKKLNDHLLTRIEQSELFTNRFGSFNKSDYEVLMFTAYLDSLDENEINDYEISIDLGITESKVRNLRIKSQLQYPREIKWEEKLASAIEKGTYDPVQKQVTITIEDPSVRNRIRYEVESRFGTVNLSLNSKQLVLPVESFLILAACAEKDSDAVLDKFNDELQKSGVGRIEKGQFKTRIFNTASQTVSILSSLLTICSGGQPVLRALIQLIENVG